MVFIINDSPGMSRIRKVPCPTATEASLRERVKTCWCSVGNKEMNLGGPLETTSWIRWISASFHFSHFSFLTYRTARKKNDLILPIE